MSFNTTIRGYQPAAGQPVQLYAEITVIGGDDYNNWYGAGIGVKATSALPTNVSEFGGHIFTTNSGGTDMDRLEYSESELYAPGGALVRQNALDKCTKTKTLDANWAAGKYVFTYALGDAGAILKASAPYRIR